jgi:hypothetical protein
MCYRAVCSIVITISEDYITCIFREEDGGFMFLYNNGKNSPVTGLEWPRGFQEVKVPRFHDNGTGR